MQERSLDITPSWWPLAGEALHTLGTCLGVLIEIDRDTPDFLAVAAAGIEKAIRCDARRARRLARKTDLFLEARKSLEEDPRPLLSLGYAAKLESLLREDPLRSISVNGLWMRIMPQGKEWPWVLIYPFSEFIPDSNTPSTYEAEPDDLLKPRLYIPVSGPHETKDRAAFDLDMGEIAADVLAWAWWVTSREGLAEAQELLSLIKDRPSIVLKNDATQESDVQKLGECFRHTDPRHVARSLEVQFQDPDVWLEDALQAVADTAEARRTSKLAAETEKMPRTPPPRLGGGAAEDTLSDILEDLKDWDAGRVLWDQMTRSVILEGPTGCGKTFLAREMCRAHGVHFEYASVAEWKAQGSGDFLEAAKRSFDRARREAPAVLMLDEIDTLMSRSGAAHNESYQRSIVNGFLTLLDPDRFPGVVFVAATNDLDAVDPAVKRTGRFDEVVKLEYPSGEDLGHIIAHHMPDFSEADIATIADQLGKAAPSDVAAAARKLKGDARRGRRVIDTGSFLEVFRAVARVASTSQPAKQKVGFDLTPRCGV